MQNCPVSIPVFAPIFPASANARVPTIGASAVAGSQGKATKMTKKTMNTVEMPTYEEVDAIVAKARAMRARAMRDGLLNAVAALKRVVTHRPENRKVSEV